MTTTSAVQFIILSHLFIKIPVYRNIIPRSLTQFSVEHKQASKRIILNFGAKHNATS